MVFSQPDWIAMFSGDRHNLMVLRRPDPLSFYERVWLRQTRGLDSIVHNTTMVFVVDIVFVVATYVLCNWMMIYIYHLNSC